ncbi:hypothetical protein [Arcanobacterium phocae]|uniref:hypothetical protein n=1 Tax=Arcanobacterium phocae TaxID=131112 RepID=UPI001C0F0FEE|nr:hypothetical protein [Arcanobacterium phocae]
MKKSLRAIASIICATGLVLGGSRPAMAGTKGGTTTCTNGAVNAVHGKQQRVDSVMTLKIGGVTFFKKGGVYEKTVAARNGGTKSWSAHSDWLTWNGTYGMCTPPIW